MNSRIEEFRETYEIYGEIGKGGGGTVYKAYHKRLKKDVVLKKIHSNLQNINTRAETDILKNLKHAYLPQVFDFLEVDGNTFTVMDYIEGESLKECIEEGRSFTQSEVIGWFKELCEALMLLHTQNPPIIHGDIKPSNIMLTPRGHICLIDFNIASIFEGKNTTISGYTPGYAAPEQIQYYQQIQKRNQRTLRFGADAPGSRDSTTDTEETEPLETYPLETPWENWREDAFRASVDVRTDIYSLGASIYHLLGGKKPRAGQEEVTDIRKLLPDINEPLAYIIAKCMQENPNERYQSVEELYQALQNIYKSSKEYRILLRHQSILRGALCVGIAAFAVVAVMGRMRMRQEKDLRYAELLQQQEASWNAGNESRRKDFLEQAIALYPARADAYQMYAVGLYERHAYEEAVQFLTELAVPYVEEGSGLANLYLLIGNSYLELGEYDKAKEALREALANDDANAEIYRDLAVVEAREGETSEAERTLTHAMECGLSDDGIAYAQGEIFYAKNEKEQADEAFARTEELTNDSDMKMRAYLMRAKIREEQVHTEENCRERIELLSKARQTLPVECQNAVLEQLAQAYIDSAEVTGKKEDSLQAAEVLKDIIDCGWDSYMTHQNLVILYQKNGMFAEEYEELQHMLDIYQGDYRVYKCLAFMEIQKQEALVREERSYEQFAEYYEQAVALYEDERMTNQSDPEMETLNRLYDDVVQGGWL